MIYAHVTEGLDPERRAELDKKLATPDGGKAAQAQREREAIAGLMRLKQ